MARYVQLMEHKTLSAVSTTFMEDWGDGYNILICWCSLSGNQGTVNVVLDNSPNGQEWFRVATLIEDITGDGTFRGYLTDSEPYGCKVRFSILATNTGELQASAGALFKLR